VWENRQTRSRLLASFRGAAASQAFSLIELLVVLAIMVFLTTMFWAGSGSDHQKQACSANLQKIYVALQIYANDSKDKFPAIADARTAEEPLDLLVPHYTTDTSIFICPAGRESSLPSGESLRPRRISYAYYMGHHSTDALEPLMSDRQVDTKTKQEHDVVFSATGKPPGNNHKDRGGNILRCDGSVEFTPPHAAFSLGTTQGVVLLNPKP
jgi:prepilin-type N-terminal cleavage/methylation domain-containing protein/prepilin-type processing-associated H-X9-DG protein